MNQPIRFQPYLRPMVWGGRRLGQTLGKSLPDDQVYGATTAPVLRLITCAGTFDQAQQSYRDNQVVSAIRVVDGGKEAGR